MKLAFHQKIISLFSTEERRGIYLLFVAILVTATLEIVGIASIMPFLAVVSSPESIEVHGVLSWLYEVSAIETTNQFLFLLGIIVLCLIIIGNAVGAFTTWLMFRIVWRCNDKLSQRLLKQYLEQRYVYFLNRNSADLSKNILAEVEVVVNGVLIPSMIILAKGSIALAVMLFLCVINPVLSIVVAAVLGGFYISVYAFIRRKLSLAGSARLQANKMRFTLAQEALGGIKEVKLRHKEREFVNAFASPSQVYSNHRAYQLTMSKLPRYILDVVAFGGILVILLYLLATRSELHEVIPVVGMYAYAGYRLMPSLQEIFYYVTTLRFNAPALDELVKELDHKPDPTHPPVSLPAGATPLKFEREVRLIDLSFKYPGSEANALRNVNLTIKPNTTIALVGLTGCGKTTLVDVFLGLLQHDTGKMLVDGHEVNAENLASWQATLDYVPQHIFLTDQSIAQNIAFGVPETEIDMTAVKRAARIAKIDSFIVDELADGYDSLVGERGVRLSGGQQQRIGLARALYRDPKILVLDEATSALDNLTENAVMEAIQALANQKTIIMIAHRLSTVKNADTIYMMKEGTIVAHGTYDQLMESIPAFREMVATSQQH